MLEAEAKFKEAGENNVSMEYATQWFDVCIWA